ncbi:MAG TPA: PDZ domain-containing protein [Gemmatimonadales bacterium]|nr:PDZ domain-containing protein [Gemmatimonadales bacterium]
MTARHFLIAGVLSLAPSLAAGQAAISAPISKVRYELTFTPATAVNRSLHVVMHFDVAGPGPVLLSLPIWTPGAYEVTYFARFVSAFSARSGNADLTWDKLDFDTWRVRPRAAGPVTVEFDFQADQFDNAKAWSMSDFAFVNGTNVFLYPEGRSLAFPATVTVHTDPAWLVATSMTPTGRPNEYGEGNYHDLVDMPFFIGHFDLDSAEVSSRWTRLATYPAGAMAGQARTTYWDQIKKLIPVESAEMGETPWKSYSIMVVFDSTFGGGSALEHQASHLSLYNTGFMNTPVIPSITAHEIFHAWNVKRLRPADLVPYRYSEEQPTPWLWVSEGVTDYYADLTMVRSGVAADSDFYNQIAGKISRVANVPPVALEDASLNIWIHPTDNTDAIYYPKGSLAGLMIDIMIRDASDNRRSLDDVMRELYRATYKTRFTGFTPADWWGAISRAAGGRSFAEFSRKYVDGRAPYPWSEVLPLAGLRFQVDSQPVARMGIAADAKDSASGGVRISQVVPGGAMEEAGLKVGDIVLRVADIPVSDPNAYGPAFRQRMAGQPEGTGYDVVVVRDGQQLTLHAKLRFLPNVVYSVSEDPNASGKAVRIREGILNGTSR